MQITFMKTLIACTVAVLLGSLGAATSVAQKPERQPSDRPVDQRTSKEQRIADWLNEQDTNKDGKIAYDESVKQMKSNFRRIDGNRDGFIDRDELGSLADRLSGAARRPRPGRAPTTKQPAALPQGVVATRDIEYANAGGISLKLDVYTPEQKAGAKRPLVVWIHGGGWRGGNKQRCPAIHLVNKGYIVASINYRLSGQAIFPAQIHDCKAAIRWLRANAEKYSIDPERVGVWGSSAGGHLVALLGTSGGVEDLNDPQLGHADQSSRVQAVCDFYGPTDLLQMDDHAPAGARIIHNAPDSPEAMLIGGPIQDNPEKVARANPITYVTKDDPPFLIMHGDQDATVPLHQSQLLADALEKAGVEYRFHTIEGYGHGFGGNRDVNTLVDAFFDRVLKSKRPERKR